MGLWALLGAAVGGFGVATHWCREAAEGPSCGFGRTFLLKFSPCSGVVFSTSASFTLCSSDEGSVLGTQNMVLDPSPEHSGAAELCSGRPLCLPQMTLT